tara:strand:- start:214 stop:1149 length:936 start_codon:yes stop_codon:yes gene_type:complete
MAVTDALVYGPGAGTLETMGGAVAEVLAAEVLEQLYDPTDIRATVTRLPWTSMGSDTMSVTQDAVPGGFTAPGQNTTLAATAYTTTHFDLTVAAYRRAYAIDDLIPVAGGAIDIDRMVANLMQGVALTITDQICGTFGTFTNVAGTALVPLSTDDVYDGCFELTEALNSGRATLVLHPIQYNDFISSLRSETGAAQFLPATAELLGQRGPGFKGSWMNLDVYVSDSVGTNGAGSYQGGLYTPGAIAYSLADVASMGVHVPAANVLMNAGELLVELDRTAADGVSAAYATMFLGVSIAENARGVEILSTATA